jgi:hypothetical protein
MYEANLPRIRKAAKDLNITMAEFNSMVIDLAFSLARANDPGGRLSNNDFDFSLMMLGANAENPEAVKAVLQQVASYVHAKPSNWRRMDKAVAAHFADPLAVIDEEWEALSSRWTAPAPPPQARSDQELLDMFTSNPEQ